MKRLIKIISICSVSILVLSFKVNAQENNVTTSSTTVDSALINYSLFAEYYKNKDFKEIKQIAEECYMEHLAEKTLGCNL